jgi:uncharacterized protein YkwD
MIAAVFVPVSASAEYRLGYSRSFDDAKKTVTVTITPKDDADTIYYTTDGSAPTQKSKVYSGGITVSKKTVIRAVEFDKKGNRAGSLKVTAKPRVKRPAVLLATVGGKQYIKITCDEKNAKIYYTTDGSDPTQKSKRYKGLFECTPGMTVKARAYKSGMTKSAVAEFTADEADREVKVSAEVKEAFECTNKERAANGVFELTLDAELCEAADIRAKELAQRYDHTRPDGSRGITVLAEVGVTYKACGENIARKQTTGAQAVAGWMNSASHRATLLSKDFDRVGIGHYYANGVHYWVQLFCRK